MKMIKNILVIRYKNCSGVKYWYRWNKYMLIWGKVLLKDENLIENIIVDKILILVL